jgi:hypothetical protein
MTVNATPAGIRVLSPKHLIQSTAGNPTNPKPSSPFTLAGPFFGFNVSQNLILEVAVEVPCFNNNQPPMQQRLY